MAFTRETYGHFLFSRHSTPFLRGVMNARYCGRNRPAVPSPIGEAARDRRVYYLFIPSFISGGRGSLSQMGCVPCSVPASAGFNLQGICLGKGGRTQVTSGKVCIPRDPSRIRGQGCAPYPAHPCSPEARGHPRPGASPAPPHPGFSACPGPDTDFWVLP